MSCRTGATAPAFISFVRRFQLSAESCFNTSLLVLKDIKKSSYLSMGATYHRGEEVREQCLYHVASSRTSPSKASVETELTKLELARARKMEQKPCGPYKWSSFHATEHKKFSI